MRKYFGNRERITLVLFILIMVIFTAISSSLLYLSERQERISRATMNAENETDLIGILITEALIKGDYVTVEQFIKQWAQEHTDVIETKLITVSGFVLASHVRPQKTQYGLTIKKPVDYGDQNFATLQIEWDMAAIHSSLNKLIIELVAIHLCLIAILLLFMWWILQRTLLQPLQKDLQESEHYNRILFEQSPIGLALCRMNGEFVDINSNVAEIMGRSVDEILQLSNWDTTPEEYFAEEHRQLEALTRTGRYGPYEKEYMHKDGHRVAARLSGTLLKKGKESFIWSSIENVTEQKQAVTALRESERMLSTLLTNLPGMAYRCLNVKPWTVLFVSDACEAITGYTPEDLINDNRLAYADLIHPDDVDMVWNTVQDAARQDKPFQVEYRIRKRDGSTRWVSEQGRKVSTPKEKHEIIEGYIADITEQHQMSEGIQNAQQELQALLDDMQTMTGIMKPDGTLTFVNNTPLKLAGISADEVLGKKLWETTWINYSAETQALIREDCAKAAAGANILHDMQMYTPDGLLWIEFSVHPVLDSSGNVRQLVAEGRDISQRKQAETELTAQRDFNNTVVETAGNIIAILDSSGNIVTFNRAAEELTGFSREELVGQSVWDWVIPEEQMSGVKNVFTKLMQGETDIAGHYVNDWLTRDGSTRTLDWRNTVLRDESNVPKYLIALGYDITERLRAENELKQLNATLEARVEERTHELELAKERADAANLAKSNFLSNMSHEIRSPLAAVIGFSESLMTDNFDQQERQKIISTIVRNGKHLQQTINDILDLSKIEAGQLNVEYINTSIFLIMGEVDSLLGMGARDKGLEFKIIYHFPLPESIKTDPVRLKQIMVNLCSNAIKFTDHGRIVVEISSDSDFRQIQFTVSDTGIGMTAEEISNVFNPFSQADSSTTRKYGGTGLGLSISNSFASALDGKLTCESNKSAGSRFTLVIRNQNKTAGTVINSLEEVSINFDDQRDQLDIRPLCGSILLAEDSVDNQELVSMYIRKTGANLTIVENGKKAIDIAAQREFDLILMDMQMPVMDGLEAIRRLRASGYKHPIVSLTANALLSDREKCLAAGADEYLVKPIEKNYFYQTLNTYLPEDEAARNPENQLPLEQTMRDNSRYRAIVERFLSKLPHILEDLSSALEEKNWAELQATSHDLKGMGGAMGYPEITELAGRINKLVKQNDYPPLATAFTKLKQYCHTILDQHHSS